MYRPLVFFGTVLLALSSPAINAQSDHDGTNHSIVPHAAGKPQEHETTGKIVRIGADAVTLNHSPVASMGWPIMTMTFALASPELAKGLAAGDVVRFRFVEKGGRYIVVQVDKMHR